MPALHTLVVVKSRNPAMNLTVAVLSAVVLDAVATITRAQEEATLNRQAEVVFSQVETRRLLQHAAAVTTPIDASNRVAADSRAIEFGRRLFFDRRLSSNGRVSCATCHDPERSWCDSRQFGFGIAATRRNVPSLYDVAFQRWFFWDGRADSLWSQALGPLENPSEHDADRVGIMRLLATDTVLRTSYEELFGALPPCHELDRFPLHGSPMRDPRHEYVVAWEQLNETDQKSVNMVLANVGKSIAAFVATIRSGESAFDIFAEGLRNGDRARISAITVAAQRGARIFVGKANCRSCHSGRFFSDGEFHSIGLAARNADDYVDAGRLSGIAIVRNDPFNQRGKYSDLEAVGPITATEQLIVDGSKWGQFKTPGLRNVARTAPYMHDGRFNDLREVVDYYSTLKGAAVLDHHEEQVLAPLRLTEDEIADLVAFLESLTELSPRAASLGVPSD